MSNLEQRIEALSDAERGWLIYSLAESHPRITKQLLNDANRNREVDAARQSMPPHPLTQHGRIPGLQLCYFRHEGATCLRMADDPLHAMATRCVASKHIPTTGAECSVCGAAGMQHEADHPGGAR